MTPKAFAQKWGRVRLKEKSAAHSHFIDVCSLVHHAPPEQADPDGKFFTFEAYAQKPDGRSGFADAWYRGRFGWEYKGKGANLERAYQQLLLYREYLENPPLLITSDLENIIIHTNFTNTVKQIHDISLERIADGDGVALLRYAFYEPEVLKPAKTQEHATRATAEAFVAVVKTLQDWNRSHGSPTSPEQLAHFVIRLFFCLFAEDLNLLPDKVFTRLVSQHRGDRHKFMGSLKTLFATMKNGGFFGPEPIPYFNGGLFDDDFVPDLPSDIIYLLLKTAQQDWSAIDPSIFGTLFERVIDENKRAQLGAHYTSKEDITLVVEPVLMHPLRRQWHELRNWAEQQLEDISNRDAVRDRLFEFSKQLGSIRVLDPACGSGNFLYISLQLLLDLQKVVCTFIATEGLGAAALSVTPAQLYGIETNPFAHELAQITVWIGYLQWRRENGFDEFQEPILRRLQNIEHKDAILAYDANGQPVEPTWPEADVIVGNPPFLGDRKMRNELGDDYVDNLRSVYDSKVVGVIDLVCYWFKKAQMLIEQKKLKRAGLIATNSIRHGDSRKVLDDIKESGDIFLAWDDRPWIQDGASVRVSIIGFDNGTEEILSLNGKLVQNINADLTAIIDLTQANSLNENKKLAFSGTKKYGPFEIDETTAKKLLLGHNPLELSNQEVVKPWVNAVDITRRNRHMWIIDFDQRTKQEAEQYIAPFAYVESHVKPTRVGERNPKLEEYWWLHEATRPGMQHAIEDLKRFIVTPSTSKHRVFVWLNRPVVPDQQLIVIARDDDYFLGVLHSCIHEIWVLRKGSRLGVGNDPRYTATVTFETFPFPWPPGQEPTEDDNDHVCAIARAARLLDRFRTTWLNPPEEDIDRIIPSYIIKNLTLTNLYNALTLYRSKYKGRVRDRGLWAKDVKNIITLEQIDELDYIHATLDRAVLDAYGWPHHLTDEQILERLLALNLERAAAAEGAV